jgi:lipoprotein signal peptidase
VVAADQWSKYLIRLRLVPGEQWAPWDWLQPYARLIHSSNTGAAFGIFPDGGLIFTVIAILVSAPSCTISLGCPSDSGMCAWRWPCSWGAPSGISSIAYCRPGG